MRDAQERLHVVMPGSMVEVMMRLAELQKRAREGDRQAQKLLDFARNYGTGPQKMRAVIDTRRTR